MYVGTWRQSPWLLEIASDEFRLLFVVSGRVEVLLWYVGRWNSFGHPRVLQWQKRGKITYWCYINQHMMTLPCTEFLWWYTNQHTREAEKYAPRGHHHACGIHEQVELSSHIIIQTEFPHTTITSLWVRPLTVYGPSVSAMIWALLTRSDKDAMMHGSLKREKCCHSGWHSCAVGLYFNP